MCYIYFTCVLTIQGHLEYLALPEPEPELQYFITLESSYRWFAQCHLLFVFLTQHQSVIFKPGDGLNMRTLDFMLCDVRSDCTFHASSIKHAVPHQEVILSINLCGHATFMPSPVSLKRELLNSSFSSALKTGV